MSSPSSPPAKTPSEQGSPTQESKGSIKDTAPETDIDDHSISKSEHDSNRDKGEDNEKASNQGLNKNLDPNQGLSAGWTFPLFGNSAAKMVATLNRTVEHTVDESNVSRFLPSSIKNRLFQGDEPFSPVGQKLKRLHRPQRRSLSILSRIYEIQSSKPKKRLNSTRIHRFPNLKTRRKKN
jgi:hypothetical protein